jgi:hypothetical protein
MFDADFMRWCHDEPLMVEWVIPLGVASDCGNACDLLIDWLEEQSQEDLFRVFGFAVDDGDGEELTTSGRLEFFEEHHMNGLLVKVSRPVKQRSGSGHSYSWGHTFTATFYAEDVEHIVAIVKAWANKLRIKEAAAV